MNGFLLDVVHICRGLKLQTWIFVESKYTTVKEIDRYKVLRSKTLYDMNALILINIYYTPIHNRIHEMRLN